MENKNIEKDFVQRTLHILDHYDGPYGVTLLINCLLGLIVLPRERGYRRISEKNVLHFADLGIREGDIRSWGNISPQEKTAARFLRSMRNAVAHIKIESISREGEIESLRFRDESGFEAVFGIETVKEMVRKLADYIQA
jgi:hypothetical protein